MTRPVRFSGSGSTGVELRFSGMPALGPSKSAELLSVSIELRVGPASVGLRSKLWSCPLLPGEVRPVPSLHWLVAMLEVVPADPTPSTTAAWLSMIRMPLALVAVKSLNPVVKVWSPAGVPSKPLDPLLVNR